MRRFSVAPTIRPSVPSSVVLCLALLIALSPALVRPLPAQETGPWMRFELRKGKALLRLPGKREVVVRGPALVEGSCEGGLDKVENSDYRVVYGETAWRVPDGDSTGKLEAGPLEILGARGEVLLGRPAGLASLDEPFAYARFAEGAGRLRHGGRGKALAAGETAMAYGEGRSWFTTAPFQELVPPEEDETFVGTLDVRIVKGKPLAELVPSEGVRTRCMKVKPALTSFSRRPVLRKYDCDFFPERYRFSVSDEGRKGDWAELVFPDDPKRLPSKAETTVEAGPGAFVRFFVAGGHVVILAPGGRARVGRTVREGERRHHLEMLSGFAWLAPRENDTRGPRPEEETEAARDANAPLDVLAHRRFVFRRGTCLLLAPDRRVPWSLSHLPCPFEENLLERSRSFGPALQKLRGEAADLIDGWVRHGRPGAENLLTRLAAYEEGAKPVFTLCRPLPEIPTAFGDGFSWHLGGEDRFDYFQARAEGDPESLAIERRFEGRAPPVRALVELAGGAMRFTPLQGLSQVAMIGAKGVELATLAILETSRLAPLPGIRRSTSYFMHASTGQHMGDLFDRPLKREEEFSRMDRAMEVILEKVDDNPFLTCLLAMSGLGLGIYVALKGPRAAARSIWRILTFFRGIMCKECDMGMDVVPLCDLPYDHRLVAVRGYFEAASFENVDEVREALDPVLRDLEGVEPPGEGHARLEGLATWCPKCHAGELLFRAHRGGKVVEEASYPLASEGFFRTVEMKHGERKKRQAKEQGGQSR